MKKLESLGRMLTKKEQKRILGGSVGGGTCTNTCWCDPVAGDECGHVTVESCSGANLDACKALSGCANVPKTTCSCGDS